jgi:hypothetical protein
MFATSLDPSRDDLQQSTCGFRSVADRLDVPSMAQARHAPLRFAPSGDSTTRPARGLALHGNAAEH